ncbi:MAG: hypothetical protein SGARI_006485, partial [Bacillariaceae sp.]
MFVPYTGKTHQLRVAAKSMGIALIGDPIYSDGTAGVNDSQATRAPRTMLHASGISIPSVSDDGDGDDDSVNIWCPPQFFDDPSIIGDDSEESSSEASALDEAV